jgi:hypothetical protein
VGTSPTGTNVQEQGVDESDVAKTDGRVVVRVDRGDLVVTDVTGARARELSRTPLPRGLLAQPELLLDGDRVTVVGTLPQPRYAGPLLPLLERAGGVQPLAGDAIASVPWLPQRTRLLSFDISDPSDPELTLQRTVQGQVLSSRDDADGTVRVVVRSTPQLPFVHPGVGPKRPGLSPQAAQRQNERLVRSAAAGAWLPDMGTGPDGRPLLGCADVRHPTVPSGLGTVTVLSFDPRQPKAVDATAVATAGDLVYSAADRLYVTTTHGRTSTVHAFDVDGIHTTYAGSGRLPGTVRDRWSMSEYGGLLRVATAVGGEPWQPRENAVVVLRQHDGRLEQVGRVDGIGAGEQIRAVRWLGDLAVVVTFRQTDPVWAVDLSDPAHPLVRDELAVPGFSTYLHPVGGGLLVGLGHDTSPGGLDRGAAAATYDVADVSSVRRVDSLSLGRATALGVDADARAFTYLPVLRTFVTAVDDWTDAAGPSFVAVRVGRGGSLRETGSWPAGPAVTGSLRALPLGGDKVALVDAGVRVVHLDRL